MSGKPVPQEKSVMKFDIDSQSSADSVGNELVPQAVLNKGYQLGPMLGSGAFSKVYKASNPSKLPGVLLACKRFDLRDKSQEIWREKCLKQEMKITMRLNHPNIVKGYDVFKTRKAAFIFMGFAEKGSVGGYLQKHKKPAEEDKCRKWTLDILRALDHIHKKGIAHRDLKPENFLLDKNNSALLSDFGFSCVAVDKETLMKGTNCGTDLYKAPELLILKEGHVYDAKKSDMFSMGVSLFEMLCLKKPYGEEVSSIGAYVKKQMNRSYEYNKKANISANGQKCCDLLLEPTVDKRLTAEEAMSHIWFK